MVLAASVLLLVACAGDDSSNGATTASPDPESTATASSTELGDAPTETAASATPAPAVSPDTSPTEATLESAHLLEPDAQRVFEHLRALVKDVGTRPAGTEAEDRAAEYIAQQLRDAGYDVAIEDFEVRREVDLSTVRPGGAQSIVALSLNGAPNGELTALVVFAGLGSIEEVAGVDLDGSIALFERGDMPFGDKAANAQAAGAVGVIIVNNEPGRFRGELGDAAIDIPVVGIGPEDAGPVRALAQAGGQVTVTADRGFGTVAS